MTGRDEIRYLDLDDLLSFATALLGDPAPVRDFGLLGSAAARPRTTAFGVDAYPDIWTKAAALLQSIAGNHALIHGNKRLGWLATAVFVELNEHSSATADNDAVFELVMRVAAGESDISAIAAELAGLAKPDR